MAMTKENKVRAADMLIKVVSGKSLREVAGEYEISAGRVDQLVRNVGRRMMNPSRWKHDRDAGWWSIVAMRGYKDVWVEEAERYKKEQ